MKYFSTRGGSDLLTFEEVNPISLFNKLHDVLMSFSGPV